MKTFILSSLFAFVLSSQSIGQDIFPKGMCFTLEGDTIIFNSGKYRNMTGNYEFMVTGQDKPLKVKILEASEIVFDPKYIFGRNEVDEFTGNTVKVISLFTAGTSKTNNLKDIQVLNFGLGKSSKNDSVVYKLYVVSEKGFRADESPNMGCAGAIGNFIMIKFDNNEVIKLDKDVSDTNCKAEAVSTYIISDKELNALKAQPIKSVRFQQSEGYLDYTIFYPDCLKIAINLIDTKKIL